jgi:hypothetical protein
VTPKESTVIAPLKLLAVAMSLVLPIQIVPSERLDPNLLLKVFQSVPVKYPAWLVLATWMLIAPVVLL